MRFLKLFALISISSLFLIGCDGVDPQEVVGVDNEPVLEDGVYEADTGVWADDNFDLRTVGPVLEESDDLADFERNINRDERFNNLDLNGDGYADYISVREFDDRNDNQRGFTLFSRFDGDDIQEIASIIFDRDRPDRRGARVYVRGNENIYGSNNFYEGNWLDKSLDIARYIFSDRDDYYVSPYYVDNYPDYYDEYYVVDTPVYRDRVTKYMVNPAMTKITTPEGKIMIKSPYPGRSYRRAYAKMKKPTKEQLVFFKDKPDKPNFAKRDKRNDKIDDRRDRREDQKDRREDRRDEKAKGVKNKPFKDNKPNKPAAKQQIKPAKRNDVKKANNKPNNKPPKAKNNKGGGKGNGKSNGKGKGKNK